MVLRAQPALRAIFQVVVRIASNVPLLMLPPISQDQLLDAKLPRVSQITNAILTHYHAQGVRKDIFPTGQQHARSAAPPMLSAFRQAQGPGARSILAIQTTDAAVTEHSVQPVARAIIPMAQQHAHNVVIVVTLSATRQDQLLGVK